MRAVASARLPGSSAGWSSSFTLRARRASQTGRCLAVTAKLAQVEQVVYFAPQPFAPALVQSVRDGARDLSLSAMDVVSGAGHDAVYLARVAPTAMIFVPCKDGISHNEIEDARPEHLEAGCNVLLRAMLAQAGLAP